MSAASLIAPFAALAVLGVAGLGAAELLAPRASSDAKAALAPLAAAAVIFLTSPLVVVGVPPLAMCVAVLGALALVTVARHRHSIETARRAAVPALLACLAIGLYGGPAVAHGTWA